MRKHFDFYGYCPPTDGKYYIGNDEYFYGEDYRTVKRYKEYKNVGFNILLLQHENSYSGEEFEGSNCQRCMIEAYKAGLDKIIVSDTRLKDLCVEKELIGANGRFATKEDLLQYIDDCTKPYREQPGFYGVQLFDEPKYWQLQSYGQVCCAIQKLDPQMKMQCNLLNLVNPAWLAENEADHKKAYEEYLNRFLDVAGIDYLMTDEYPFHKNYKISQYSIPVYQVLAKVCRERKVEFRMVLQSFSGVHFISTKDGRIEGDFNWRRMTEPDMYWQMNLAMGFGCREYSFFTYFTKSAIRIKSNDIYTCGVDGAQFINQDGSRTKLYNYTKRIIAEVKRFETVLLKYQYENSYFCFEEGKNAEDFNQTKMVNLSDECPIDIKISKGVALVTKSRSNNATLYMIENIGNVKDEFDGQPKMKLKIHLDNDAKNFRLYKKGVQVSRKMQNGTFQETLGCGHAIFIEIDD